jgi:hypothetical protein
LHEPVFHLDYSINILIKKERLQYQYLLHKDIDLWMHCFVDNDQSEDSTIKNSSEDAFPHTIAHSNKKKKLSSPNLKIMGEEIEEHNSIPTVDDIVLGSSSNPEGERTDHGKEVKVLPALFYS